MDYKRIYRIAAKIILSDTFTEEQWKKYHEEHPYAKRENHTVVPNPSSTSHEEEHKKHTKEDKSKNCGVSGTERKNDQYFCIRKLITELVKLTEKYFLLFLRLEFQDFIIQKTKKMKSKDDYITSG